MSETIRWWLVLQLVALPLLPLCLAMFRRLPDRGYALSKPFALLVNSWKPCLQSCSLCGWRCVVSENHPYLYLSFG